MGDRHALKEFWYQYSDTPDIETMMLNKNAEEFDEQDRRDIWISLPDLKGLRVIEIGSGIGRFTAALASVAKHVLATDFVQSFIEKNEENNGHLGNVSFKCADAAHLSLDSECCDFVFTNWLLMYLTDVEIVHFLESVLRWLTPNGYLHFRESCSESSKRTPTNPNDTSNPTHYRHICQYLNLLDRIRVKDERTGKLMKFEVLWAKSVETYVRRPSHAIIPNWRQIHMILRKVWANDEGENEFQNDHSLVQTLTQISIQGKEKFGREMTTRENLWGARSPFQPLVLQLLQEKIKLSPSQTALTYFGSNAVSVSPFILAETFGVSILDINTDYWMYDYDLAQANAKGDKRLRFQYIPDIVRDDQKWQYIPERNFDIAIASVTGKLEDMLAILSRKVKSGGRIVLLESFSGGPNSVDVDSFLPNRDSYGTIETEDVTNSVASHLTAAVSQLQERAPELYELQHVYQAWLKPDQQTNWRVILVEVK